MKKNKYIKNLIVSTLIISINTFSLDVFAIQPSENSQIYENESTILDGEIGEWDPVLNDKPNFNKNGLEVDGNRPQEGQYETISVTIPLNMEFYVLPSSHTSKGNFYSPVYYIKNNGSKNIQVSIDSFNRVDNIEHEDEETTNLYVEKINSTDKRTQIELKLNGIHDLNNWWEKDKSIDLTSLNELDSSEKEIYTLSANEEKGVTFDAQKWELPNVVSNKQKAISNFNASFIFSIVR